MGRQPTGQTYDIYEFRIMLNNETERADKAEKDVEKSLGTPM